MPILDLGPRNASLRTVSTQVGGHPAPTALPSRRTRARA